MFHKPLRILHPPEHIPWSAPDVQSWEGISVDLLDSVRDLIQVLLSMKSPCDMSIF
jgi:hypothetical protein